MASSIWKVTATKIGTIQPFSSEYDMEAFILNNPQIVGCVGKSGTPCIIRQQISTIKGNNRIGRIDLIGLAEKSESEEGKYELRIFELKKDVIDEQAVEQLDLYIQNWPKQPSAKESIREWLKQEIGSKIEERELENLINRPIGVLVGSRFLPNAIEKASQKSMLGIRLARFFSTDKDYYIVVEDEVGTAVSRQVIGWELLIKKQLIRESDVFITSIGKGKEIVVKPVIKGASPSSKNVQFDAKTNADLKTKKKDILKNARNIFDEKRAKAIEDLDSTKGISITAATGLLFLAYNAKFLRSYWVPGPLWKHKRTGKLLSELLEEARS